MKAFKTLMSLICLLSLSSHGAEIVAGEVLESVTANTDGKGLVCYRQSSTDIPWDNTIGFRFEGSDVIEQHFYFNNGEQIKVSLGRRTSYEATVRVIKWKQFFKTDAENPRYWSLDRSTLHLTSTANHLAVPVERYGESRHPDPTDIVWRCDVMDLPDGEWDRAMWDWIEKYQKELDEILRDRQI